MVWIKPILCGYFALIAFNWVNIVGGYKPSLNTQRIVSPTNVPETTSSGFGMTSNVPTNSSLQTSSSNFPTGAPNMTMLPNGQQFGNTNRSQPAQQVATGISMGMSRNPEGSKENNSNRGRLRTASKHSSHHSGEYAACRGRYRNRGSTTAATTTTTTTRTPSIDPRGTTPTI